MSPLVSVLHDAIKIATPFLLAAMGGLFTEHAGILNIALEGLMLIAAFFSVFSAGMTGSIGIGLLAGVLSSMFLALIFAYTSLNLRANIFIAGIATNLLAVALTALLASALLGHRGVYRFESFPSLPLIPQTAGLGPVGDILTGHNVLVYLSWLLIAGTSLVLYRTPFGLRMRAAGYAPRTVRTTGLNPRRYQLLAILISGLTCGLSGAFLSLNLEAWVPNVTAGRGWIALVIIYLGYKKPLGLFLASLFFGLAESLSNFSQGFLSLPSDIILAFPYIMSMLALLIYSIWEHRRRQVKRQAPS